MVRVVAKGEGCWLWLGLRIMVRVEDEGFRVLGLRVRLRVKG
jgi:hypothetical protein